MGTHDKGELEGFFVCACVCRGKEINVECVCLCFVHVHVSPCAYGGQRWMSNVCVYVVCIGMHACFHIYVEARDWCCMFLSIPLPYF